jgi:hypothetical protein
VLSFFKTQIRVALEHPVGICAKSKCDGAIFGYPFVRGGQRGLTSSPMSRAADMTTIDVLFTFSMGLYIGVQDYASQNQIIDSKVL